MNKRIIAVLFIIPSAAIGQPLEKMTPTPAPQLPLVIHQSAVPSTDEGRNMANVCQALTKEKNEKFYYFEATLKSFDTIDASPINDCFPPCKRDPSDPLKNKVVSRAIFEMDSKKLEVNIPSQRNQINGPNPFLVAGHNYAFCARDAKSPIHTQAHHLLIEDIKHLHNLSR